MLGRVEEVHARQRGHSAELAKALPTQLAVPRDQLSMFFDHRFEALATPPSMSRFVDWRTWCWRTLRCRTSLRMTLTRGSVCHSMSSARPSCAEAGTANR